MATIQTFENSKDLVKLLKKRRLELKLSQAELAKLCNLSLNGISKFESSGNNKGSSGSSSSKREIKLSTLFKLSRFLGIKLALKLEE
jgi:transcriptional regulator with XRE-family HTH domain